MLDRFEKAASNDLKAVRHFIQSNNELINVGCPDENTREERHFLKVLGIWVGALPLTVITLVAAPPVALGIAAAEWYYLISGAVKLRSRKNWTMLDYAAENGAISVAVYLIVRGADTSNRFFLDLAKENGHQDLYNVCSILCMLGEKLKSRKNKIIELRRRVYELDKHMAAALKEIEEHVAEVKRLETMIKGWENLYSEAPEIIDELSSINNQQQKTSVYGMYSSNNPNIFPFGLKDKQIPYVPGDCFFDAVIANSKQSWNKQMLRAGIYNALLEERDDIHNHIDYTINLLLSKPIPNVNNNYETLEIPCNNYQEYCEHILKNGAWVDNIEINAMCSAFKVCCVVVHKDVGSRPHIFGAEFAASDIPPIIVGYVDQNHYVALDCPTGLTPLDTLLKIQRMNVSSQQGQREELREGFGLC